MCVVNVSRKISKIALPNLKKEKNLNKRVSNVPELFLWPKNADTYINK